MNAADVCHEVDGCPGLYVDAFRGRYLRRMQDPDNAFLLSHYHGDHYQNLPRDGKYKGPALIHCTPVTAALLVQVHKVPEQWVVPHEYEQTFSYSIKGRGNEQARITFYDANHCPGACIILIQLPSGTVHLHTGDMRYHERFKSYPLLRDVVANNTLDIVYLDTTYSHPKHDFVPQDEAVRMIADSTVELVGPGCDDKLPKRPKTLILLSCYSIGKEKVLWEAATRTNHLVYVGEKKLKMLQCVQGHESQEVSSQIIHRCTQDENATPIHVIPMGLAGEIWPFFRPNFVKCADYARRLEQTYEKVVAFLPTGWAHGSKWNREHAVSQKTVPSNDHYGPVDVEVRLVPYSEHSAFSELVSFVHFLRPRKVIPTVFTDDADYRKIEQRFCNLLDTKRAKKAFFRSMEKKSAEDSSKTEFGLFGGNQNESENVDSTIKSSTTRDVSNHNAEDDSDGSVEVIRVDSSSMSASTPVHKPIVEEQAETLVGMGFPAERARQALHECSGDFDRAVDKLLTNHHSPSKTTSTSTRNHSNFSPVTPQGTSSTPRTKRKRTAAPANARITQFFVKKKS